jgi:glycosyltransferase involved in cell wall biosynthesis
LVSGDLAMPSTPVAPSQSLRILAVNPVYLPCVGGAERLLQAILENLVHRGHDATVLTLDARTVTDLFDPGGSGLPAEERIGGVRIRRVCPTGGAVGSTVRRTCRFLVRRRLGGVVPGGWAHELAARPSPAGMLRWLRREDYDVVVCSNWWSPVTPACAAVASRRGLPVVALPLLHVEQQWSRRPILGRALPDCAASVALTPSEVPYHRALGARAVEVIGCGIASDWGQRADGAGLRRRLGLGDQPVVGFVGRQDEGKGVPRLIQAMRTVWAQRPSAVLLLAGMASHRDEPTKRALAALTPEERGRVAEVSDFGSDEAPSVFAACDVLAQPSVEESFGIVLTEAWMVGRPVIGASIPATRDLVSDGADGLIVPPADPEALAAAIIRLIDSPADRARMGEHGRAKVLERYTVSSMVDRWESLLRSVARRGAPGSSGG